MEHMSSDTSLFKKDFIDETIITTPKPQASSTIEKKTNYTRKFKDKLEQLDVNAVLEKAETESVASSRLSTQSSLGIFNMDQVEDMKENDDPRNSKVLMPQPSESITERLLLQRKLAQDVLDKANKRDSRPGGLPLHLLQPDAQRRNSTLSSSLAKNESTVNISELENMNKEDKMSFNVNQISARSSLLGNNSKTNELSVPSQNRIDMSENDNVSEYSMKCNAIFNKIRQSDIALQRVYDNTASLLKSYDVSSMNSKSNPTDLSTDSWNMNVDDSLIMKLQNELFVPGELAEEKLKADELLWCKENDSIPFDSKNRLELSCFSGVIGDVDVSVGSKVNEKVAIGDYFQRRTEEMNALDLKSSPKKSYKPIALLNSTESVLESPRSQAPAMLDSYGPSGLEQSKQDPKLSISSIVSVSHIEKALENMRPGDTPSKVMNYLMNHKYGQNKYVDSPSSVVSKNTTAKTYTIENKSKLLQNNNVLKESSEKLTKMSTTPIKGLNYEPIEEIKENIETPEKSNRFQNSHTSNSMEHDTPKSRHSTSPLRRKSDFSGNYSRRSLAKVVPTNLSEIIVISDDDSDSKDNLKQNLTTNKTLTTITNSPSISCSELEFSEDEIYVDAESDEWVKIDERLDSCKTSVYIPSEVDINIQSFTRKWLLIKLKVGEIKHNTNYDTAIKLNLVESEQLLKYKEKQTIPIQFITYGCGLIELTVIIELTDMVTKKKKNIEHVIIIESYQPNINVSTDKIDFGMIPEDSHKTLQLTLENLLKVDLPVILEIKQKHSIFSFESEISVDNSNAEFITKTNLILPVDEEIILGVNMLVPFLSDLQLTSQVEEFYGKIIVYLLSEEPKILKEIKIVGKMGKTKIQFNSSCLPMKLHPGQTKKLHMKNGGVVDLELNGIIFDRFSKIEDDIFSLKPKILKLKPKESGFISITFNTVGKITESITRDLRLTHPNGPKFLCPLEGLPNSSSPKIIISGEPYKYSPKSRKTPDGVSPKSKTPTSNSPRLKPNSLRIGSANSYHRNSPKSSRSNSPHNSYQSISPRSGTSDYGSYVTNGKLPIETNKYELVWSCIKPGKTQYQEFVIRNRVNQRIRFYASIIGTAYKIVKDQNEFVTHLPIMLHANESRTIVISFSPMSVQAYYSKLSFTTIENNDSTSDKAQCILLFGYGGHSTVEIQKVAKASTGKMWLSLGQLDYQTHLEQSFVLRNSGSLSSFAQINIICKQLYRFMDSSIKITPKEVVLHPNQEVEVYIQFKLRQEDFKLLQNKNSEVLEVATLQVISGPEITRGRIRKICNRNSAMSLNHEMLSKLCVQFPDEKMPSDLSVFKERAVGFVLKELLQGLTTREISLTIEQNLESSLLGLAQPDDDTLMFHSLYNQTAHLTLDHSTVDNIRRSSGGYCTIVPTNVTLIYPAQSQQAVLLQSKHSRPMPFEINIESSELQVEPNIGIVPPGEETLIIISCSTAPTKIAQNSKVMIYVENQVLEITVKILRTRQTQIQ